MSSTSSLTLPLPSSLHDQVCICALEKGLTVNQFVRRALEREVRDRAARIIANKTTENSAVIRSGRY